MENESETQLLEKSIYILKLIGLWPDENNGRYVKKIIKILMFVILVFFSFGVISETFRELKGLRDDVNSLLTSLLSVGIITATVSFIIAYYVKHEKISQVVGKFKLLESYFKPSDVVKTERRLNIFTTILFYYTNVADVLYVFLPFLQYSSCLEMEKKEVHLKHVPCGMWTPLWYPFDYTRSPLYEFILFINLCFTYVFSVNSIAIVSLDISVTVHLVGHLRNMKKQFKIALEDEKSLKKLKKCIEYHIEIIKFADYNNECFSLFNLLITIISTYMIGVLEFQIILVNDNPFELFRYAFHLYAWITILFILNYVAQLLWDESLSVGDDLYNINWIDCPISIQKDILFILQRCAVPLTSNTGPFGVMKNETFLWILQTAYTFYAIFSNVKGQ